MPQSHDIYGPGPDGLVRLTREQADQLVVEGWKEGELDFSTGICVYTKKQGRKATTLSVKIVVPRSPVKNQSKRQSTQPARYSDVTSKSHQDTVENTPQVPKSESIPILRQEE